MTGQVLRGFGIARDRRIMSQYLTDISTALLRVFGTANKMQLDDHRLAGYAANLDFWADETEHCLKALKGFGARQGKFDEALKSTIKRQRDLQLRLADPLKLRYGEATTSDQLMSYRSETEKLQESVTTAGKTFFNKLRRAELIDETAWLVLEDRFEFLKKA